MKSAPKLKPAPKLGIIRLEYDYDANPGDIDHPGTFKYEVVYREV